MQAARPHTPARTALAPALAGWLAALCWLAVPCAAHGDQPSVRIVPQGDLRFGTFLVFGAGSRTVSAAGAVINQALEPVAGDAPAPARFTVSYDRGNNSSHVLDVEMDLVVSASPMVRIGGVEARLSALVSDLPGALQIQPGRPIRLRMTGCRTRVCSRTFQVGGRLDVTRQNGQARLSIPIPLEATLVSAIRQ